MVPTIENNGDLVVSFNSSSMFWIRLCLGEQKTFSLNFSRRLSYNLRYESLAESGIDSCGMEIVAGPHFFRIIGKLGLAYFSYILALNSFKHTPFAGGN